MKFRTNTGLVEIVGKFIKQQHSSKIFKMVAVQSQNNSDGKSLVWRATNCHNQTKLHKLNFFGSSVSRHTNQDLEIFYFFKNGQRFHHFEIYVPSVATVNWNNFLLCFNENKQIQLKLSILDFSISKKCYSIT